MFGHLQRKGGGEKGPGLPPEVLLGLFQQCVKVKRIKFALYRSRVKVFPVGVYKGRERQTSRSLTTLPNHRVLGGPATSHPNNG